VADIPDGDHVSRYCKPSAVGKNGLPTSAAFQRREGEEWLSVNWLEFFREPDLEAAVERVREAFRSKGYALRPNGRFAVINAGEARAVVKNNAGYLGRVEHLPTADDESHAGLSGYTAIHDLAVAVDLRALIEREHIHPAVPAR